MIQALALLLLRRYCAVAPRPPKEYRGGIPNVRLRRVLDYIHSHLDQEIALGRLAAEAGMSQYHFARQFKTTVGDAPYGYVVKARMARARALLEHTELPIAVIAARVGYRNQSRFAALFKRFVGIIPSHYRKYR